MKKSILFPLLVLIFLMGYTGIAAAGNHPEVLMAQFHDRDTYIKNWQTNYEKELEKQGLTMSDITQYGYIPDPMEDLLPSLGIRTVRLLSAGSLPESYDLREYGRVTPVKDQGEYGTCWAHAAINSIESSVLTQNLANDIDLSERHLAYFTYNRGEDPLGNLTGDSYEAIGNTCYNLGGVATHIPFILNSWTGPVLESRVPYNELPKDPDKSIQYNSDAFHVKNVYWYSLSERDSIKSAIQTYGAGAISYGSYSAFYNTGTFNGEAYTAYYCPEEKSSNHAVSVIGWDDNFSAGNFSYAPEGNGAWLIKQSWGEDWKTQNGYFWLSYYDNTLADLVFFYEAEPTLLHERSYQYDGSAMMYPMEFDKAANVFTAQADETISAVSFAAATGADSYTVRIYTDCTGSSPESGTLAVTAEGSCKNEYIKTVDLPQEVSLRKGQQFSVVVDLNGSGSGYYMMDVTDDWGVLKSVSYGCSSQSFVYSAGKWYDLNPDCSSDAVIARIKAFTTGTSSDSSREAVQSSGTMTAVSGLNAAAGGKGTLLSWNALDNVNYYEIFSADSADAASWQTAGTSTVPSFTVNNPAIGSVRFYKVRALFTDGQYSGFSEAVRVQSGMTQIMM